MPIKATTKSSSAALVTLSPKSAQGSSVYNSYYYFTQLSGYYAAGLEVISNDAYAKEWSRLVESSLTDIEKLFQIWEWVLTSIRNGVYKSESPLHWDFVARSCARLAVVHKNVNQWTFTGKWINIGLIIESRWIRILKGFEHFDPTLWQQFSLMFETSKKRQSILYSLVQAVNDEGKKINSWFQVQEMPEESNLGTHGIIKKAPHVVGVR